MKPPVEPRDPAYWRSCGDAYPARFAALVCAVVLSAAIVYWLDWRRIVPEDLGLGVENWAAPAFFERRRINVWRLEEYSATYPPVFGAKTADILWLGNSQLHAINQIVRDRDNVAAFYASKQVNEPVFCLSLPNANLQEHLVTLQWALTRRRVRWVILPLVFDKLRNDGLRDGYELLYSSALIERLAAHPVGDRLAAELVQLLHTAKRSEPAKASAGQSLGKAPLSTWLHDVSLQEVSERHLDDVMSRNWSLWLRRPALWATFLNDLYQFRNWIFSIKSTSKRPMLPIPFSRNMSAFREMLEIAKAEGVAVLVYIAPIRQDVEPPYNMSEYLPWKEEVRQFVSRLATEGGSAVIFADLDTLVPARYWGTVAGSSEIDFMHFQGEGHRLLGTRIAELLAASNSKAEAAEANNDHGKNIKGEN